MPHMLGAYRRSTPQYGGEVDVSQPVVPEPNVEKLVSTCGYTGKVQRCGVQGRRSITWVAAGIAATTVSAFAFGGGVQEPSDQAEALQQQIAELEAKLAQAKAQLEALQQDPPPAAAADGSEAGGGEAGPSQPPVDAAGETPMPTPAPEVVAVVPPVPTDGSAPGDPSSVPTDRGAFARWLSSWKSRIEVGVNGAEGNSTRQSLRLGFATNRKTEKIETKLSSTYKLTQNNGERSENRLQIDGRNDWLQGGDSHLRYFVTGTLEFDEFQAWDARASGFGGLGYEIIKTDKTTLLGRGGFGGSQRFGGTDDEFRAEAFLAGDLSHKINDAQKLTAALEYLPDTDGWSEYRLNGNASWEMRIDPDSELFLRVGVATRYDSDPGSAKTTDVDYFVNLGWAF